MKSQRNSSFELLRIILILLILIEHGNMWFIGAGYKSEAEHIVKCLVECTCIGAVNAFVLISGWFGIRSGMKKIGGLIFEVLFTTVPVLIGVLAAGLIPVQSICSLDGIYNYIFGGNGYWFVIAYIGLVIFTPILNSAIESMSRIQYRNMLSAIYALILIYDFALKSDELGMEGGYSVGWFIYLYLLAAYIRRYGLGIFEKYPVTILLFSIAIQSLLFINGYIGLRYTNPFILAEAISLILIFRRFEFHSNFINYVAKGCLMAYLLHMQPIFVVYIRRFLTMEYQHYGYWLYMCEVLALSLALYMVALLLERIQTICFSCLDSCTRKIR